MTEITGGELFARALIEQMGHLPVHLRRSLTWARGLEMAQHASITATLSMPVYFCDPHHPWQRGTNENTTDGTECRYDGPPPVPCF